MLDSRPPLSTKQALFDPLFATSPDRRGTGSEKWDRWAGQEILPMWVADMDFQTDPVILEALHAAVEHGVFGYTHEPPDFAPALAEHLLQRHGWQIDPSSVVGMPGVVNGLAITARLLSEPGDEILTFTPIYPPFLTLPALAGRRCRQVPLVRGPQRFEIDWDALAAAISPTTKLLWLCHPHNPTGMVFGASELLGLAEFAERHALRIVSDEIWADLVLDPSAGHIPLAALDHPAARRAITLVAPSKTWNLAGLGCAAGIVPDPQHRRQWRGAGGGLVPMVNPLGYAAAAAAWRLGDPWRQRLLGLLRRHMQMVATTVEQIPGLEWLPPHATYLAWIDCRGTGLADPFAACLAAGLGPSDGLDFGAPGFIRLNVACPTDRLEMGLSRLQMAFSSPSRG